MILLIDAGNTRIKWATVGKAHAPTGGPVWLHQGAVSHAEMPTLKPAWAVLPISRIVMSNVAGEHIGHALELLLASCVDGVKAELFSATANCAGVKNAYAQATQLGSDRFASAIGAHALFPFRSLLVVTCGTATTIDAVTVEGTSEATFIGGMILPGLQLMAQSLAKNTAQLPQVAESLSVTRLFADNTELAIVSGCINAQVGAILRAYETQLKMQHYPVSCIISGGAAPYLIAHLGIACEHVDNLVLTGLFIVAKSIATQ
ncbi:MAG: type III pantothenate kinase [Cytophaga sp.]|nr:type III pantothenate kinase [Undibacterium sp.]